METAHPSMLDLLLETHIGLERQGPGSVEVIKQALEFLKPLDQFSKIARFRLWNRNTNVAFSEVFIR